MVTVNKPRYWELPGKLRWTIFDSVWILSSERGSMLYCVNDYTWSRLLNSQLAMFFLTVDAASGRVKIFNRAIGQLTALNGNYRWFWWTWGTLPIGYWSRMWKGGLFSVRATISWHCRKSCANSKQGFEGLRTWFESQISLIYNEFFSPTETQPTHIGIPQHDASLEGK